MKQVEAEYRLAEPSVSRETQERLDVFVSLLRKWASHINLVSNADQSRLWRRHVLDSLELQQLIPPRVQTAVDLGSGAGFPGLILAIATDIRFTLIESDQRKAAFLTIAVQETRANARVVVDRIEQCRSSPADLITARGLAGIPMLLDWSEHLRTQDTVCLFPKRASADPELDACDKWTMKARRYRSAVNANAVVWRLTEIRRVHRN